MTLKTQKQVIEQLLANDERCRNDDKWLTYKFIRYYSPIFVSFEDFSKIPAFANAQKLRQFIQHKECKYLPTDPKVINKRRLQELKFKEVFIYD